MCAAWVIMAVACVDESFNIDDVSKEVTIGGGTTVLPLGYLENKTLGDLLGGDGVEGLEKDEEGNLSFKHSGESKTIDIEGISTVFDIPKIKQEFEVDYPAFDFDMEPVVIEEEDDIPISGLDGFSGYIPEGVTLPNIEGSYSYVIDSDKLHIEFDVPEQISNVKSVIFRDVENGHHGAPLHLSVALNGLKDINAGGELKFNLSIEGGTFKILDAQNTPIYDGNQFMGTYAVAEGAENVDFAIYIESITNTTALDSDHHLDIPLKLKCDMEFDMATKPGYFDFSDKPHIELTADFEYADASVVVDDSVSLVEYKVEGTDPIEITGLPEELKMVKGVGMKQDERAILNLYAHGLEWLGDIAEDVSVEIALPDYLKLHFVDGENYTYDTTTCTLATTIAELGKGVQIGIDELYFEDGLTPDEEGTIKLMFEPSIVAHFNEDAEISISSLKHEGGLTIEVGIEETQLCIESMSGQVDYSYEVNQEFALTGLSELNLEIAGLGLKPVIEVTISHPLTMETKLSGSITPSTAGVANEQNMVAFDDVKLAAASYADGSIQPVEMVLVIADESLREKYSDAKYTFVACDVTKLLLGTLPDRFNIKLALSVDPDEVQTLYMDDENFSITYGYKVDIPFTIDNSFEIHYSDEIGGLNSTFDMLADYDIKVGDVAVIATVTNTTPLEFAAQVKFKDVNGEYTEAQVLIDEDARIKGSSDGVTPTESALRLALDLGEDGKISKLALVDAIAVDLWASSAANESAVALNNEQYVGVKLQLELAGGITVDLKDFNLK